jgi:ribosomal protein S27AE
LVKYQNTCTRCGQSLELVDEPFSDYKSALDKNGNELCPRCYQDLCDENY